MQNNFSELLNDAISKSDVSKNEIIRECDIDRSSFFKFLNGTRRPTSEQFSKICSKLQLSPSDAKHLQTAYSNEVLGEHSVRINNQISDLLWLLNGSVGDALFEKASFNRQYKNLEVIVDGKKEVFELMTNTILKGLHTGDDYKLDLFLPVNNEGIFKWLNSLLKSDIGRRVCIRHLIEFPSRNIDSDQAIVERLKFALCFAASYSDSYSGFYYYSCDPIDTHIGVFCAYSLITPLEVIVLNKRMDKAIVITDQKCRDEYENYFMMSLNSSELLIKKITQDMIESEMNNAMSYRYGLNLHGINQITEKTTVFVSSTNLANIFELNREMPSVDKKTNLKEKQRILKVIKRQLGNHLYLIDERSLPSANSWCITVLGKDRIIYSQNDSKEYFVIEESGMVGLLIEFMQRLPNSGLVLQRELASEIIDELYRRSVK